jgi:hypothetical protein
MASATKRQALRREMIYMLGQEPRIHYPLHDIRTETIHAVRTHDQLAALIRRPQGITIDCSQTVTLLFHVVGLKDPNGHAYREDGFTGTLLAALPHYGDPRHALIGALVVYGPGTGDHVDIVFDPDPVSGDPMLFGHGLEAGPYKRRLSQAKQYHRKPTVFLNISSL